MTDFLASILKHLTRPREPMPGELYWVENAVLGITSPTTTHHPVLVIAGQNVKGGPVAIVPGSSTRKQRKGHVVLEVSPADCETGGRLDVTTRFWVNEPQRIDVAKLGRPMGKLSEAKTAELLRLKGRIIT